IVPATGLSTVRVTQTRSFAQPCVSMEEIVGSLSAWTGPADSANAAHTLTRSIRGRLLISISLRCAYSRALTCVALGYQPGEDRFKAILRARRKILRCCGRAQLNAASRYSTKHRSI